jgi:prolyl-tRNA synthetase
MRESELFLKILKDAPKDEVAKNAELLIRGSFVSKLMAGVYTFLPLGHLVRERVMRVVREEMNALGGQEMLMPALHPKSIWEKTGRWEVMGTIMYQFEDHSGKNVGLGPTHEEIIADAAKTGIVSYTDLPKALYQIQTKFRDEPRAKSGLLRGKEFTMKDLYSFHADEESLNEFYERAKASYLRIFSRLGLDAYVTEASGGDFSKEYSHEFMVPADAGEDTVYLCAKCRFARNKEIVKSAEGEACPTCGAPLAEKRAIEVGNIFKLGTKFSEAQGLYFRGADGAEKPVIMASYGIGIERLMGTIVEIHHDENGIIWPSAVAPFEVYLAPLGKMTPELQKTAEAVYSELSNLGVSVLLADKDNSPGEKLFAADFLGFPWRAVLSEKTAGKLEVKPRSSKETALMDTPEFIAAIRKSQ